MMFFSWISTVWADVQVDHTITEQAIQGQPVYVDLLLLNTGSEAVQIQDIVRDRWQITFTVSHNGQTHTLRSQRPTDIQPKTRTLEPRDVLELHLELPNSRALQPGKHTLSIDFPLDSTRHIETEFVVHTPNIQWADLDIFNYEAFLDEEDLLWSQPFNQHHILFAGLNNPTWIQTIPVPKAQNTVHIGSTHHTYWRDRNRITVIKHSGDRVQSPQELSIPWKDFEFIGRGVTDLDGGVFIPIWVPNPNGTGTLYSVQPQPNNTITFRKIRTGKKPHSMDVAITQASTPVFLLQYPNTLEVFSLTTVGEERIDKLPPKSIQIPLQSTNVPWMHSTLVVSETSGLHIAAIDGQDTTHTLYTFGLSGSLVDSHSISEEVPIQKVHTLGISKGVPFALIESTETVYHWSKESGLVRLPFPLNGVINQRQTPLTLWSLSSNGIQRVPLMEPKK